MPGQLPAQAGFHVDEILRTRQGVGVDRISESHLGLCCFSDGSHLRSWADASDTISPLVGIKVLRGTFGHKE